MSTKNQSTVSNRRRHFWNVFFNAVSVLALLAVVVYGIVVYFHLNNDLYTDDAQVESYITPLNVRVSGYIASIRFEENQQVRKGDTLVVIDDREYKVQLEQALANLQDAVAGRNVTVSNVAVVANDTQISEANIAELKARLDNDATNLNRYEHLLKADVVSQFQYDQVAAEYKATQARYNALVSKKMSTRLSTGTATKNVAVSEAAILRAKASVELARLNISYCYILAPYDGVMGRRRIDIGQLMSPGQPLATIVQSGQKWVTANYPENQVGNIHIGDLLTMRVDALPGKSFQGRVVSFSGATGSRYSAVPVDNSTGNFIKVRQRVPVRILFTDNNPATDLNRLMPGMNVEIITNKTGSDGK